MTSSMSRRRAWWICAEVTSIETIHPTFGKGLLHHSEYYHSRKDPKIKGQSWIKGSSCSAYLLPIWCICTQMAKEQCNILEKWLMDESLWPYGANWCNTISWKIGSFFRHGETLAFEKCEEKLNSSLSTATCNGFQFRSPQLCMKDQFRLHVAKEMFFCFVRSRRRLSARQSNLQTLWIKCAWDKIPIKRLRIYKSTNHIPIFPYSSSLKTVKSG